MVSCAEIREGDISGSTTGDRLNDYATCAEEMPLPIRGCTEVSRPPKRSRKRNATLEFRDQLSVSWKVGEVCGKKLPA